MQTEVDACGQGEGEGQSHDVHNKKNQHCIIEIVVFFLAVNDCFDFNKNLTIANRSRVSCAHNTLRASIGLNITP